MEKTLEEKRAYNREKQAVYRERHRLEWNDRKSEKHWTELEEEIQVQIEHGAKLHECCDCGRMLPDCAFRRVGKNQKIFRCKKCAVAFRKDLFKSPHKETKRLKVDSRSDFVEHYKPNTKNMEEIDYMNMIAWHYNTSYGMLSAFPEKYAELKKRYEEEMLEKELGGGDEE